MGFGAYHTGEEGLVTPFSLAIQGFAASRCKVDHTAFSRVLWRQSGSTTFPDIKVLTGTSPRSEVDPERATVGAAS